MSHMETRHISILKELQGIAEEVLSLCVGKDSAQIIGLSGDLGAGKTAFVKELAKLLNVSHEITSPTFVIMKSYPIPKSSPITQQFKTLSHIDAYRIESDDEMRVLGFAELVKDQTQLVCIEWPEKIQNLIPSHVLTVVITLNNDGTREISYGS